MSQTLPSKRQKVESPETISTQDHSLEAGLHLTERLVRLRSAGDAAAAAGGSAQEGWQSICNKMLLALQVWALINITLLLAMCLR